MKDHPKKRKEKGRLSRRDFLKVGAAGLGVAALGGVPDMLRAAQAPAFAKGTKLSILQGSYFIAPSQDLYKRQAQEWGKANGVEVSCPIPELAGPATQDRGLRAGRRLRHRRAMGRLELSL